MTTPKGARWLSKDERVEVLSVVKENRYCYRNIHFWAKRADGTFVMIDRLDLLLPEEEAMIDELAYIFQKYNNPFRSDRYKDIMRTLVKEHVPFGKMLLKLREQPRNQQVLLDLGALGGV
jgi:hypothetical protein